MAHPFNEHRRHKVEHARVGKMTAGYDNDAAQDRRLIHEQVKASALKRASGGRVDSERDAVAVTDTPSRQRLDKPMRARGGRAKHKGTNVNITIGAGGATPSPAPALPMAGAPGLLPAGLPPRPPMPPPGAVPPGAMPPGAMPPGPLPGVRSHGGRAYAKGGAVSGPAWTSSMKNRAPFVGQSGQTNKNDVHNVGRSKPITYKTGGAVEHPVKGAMAPHLPGGAGGGLARLRKRKMVHNGMAP